MSFFEELKRRNVFRVGIAYGVAAWVLLQVADLVLENINAPDWVIQAMMLMVALGFVAAVVIAWAYEMTPEGIKKESEVDRSQSVVADTGKKLDRIVIGFLVVAVAVLLFRQSGEQPAISTEPAPTAATETAVPASDTTTSDRTTIAVLPFVNMSSDPEQEYFSDGITEEILNRLAKIQDLEVAARTSVFAFKDQSLDIREVAQLLGVGTVLEGSVRRDGETVRITAQLIRASDGFHLWSETYDRTLDSIFAVQDEISTEIASALQVSLGITSRTASTDPQVYDLYLKAKALHRKRGAGLLKGLELFHQALSIDPEFAPAWAGLSHILNVIPSYASYEDLEKIGDAQAQSMAAAQKALELDPDLTTALHAMANNLLAQLKWSEAQKYYEAALSQDPESTDIMEDYGHFLLYSWQTEKARKVADRMIALDPYVPIFRFMAERVYAALGKPAIQDEHIAVALEVSPDLANVQYQKLVRLLEQGRSDDAHALVERIDFQDFTTTSGMHRMIDWTFSTDMPMDEEMRQALEYFPEFALVAGQYELYLEQLRQVPLEHWETTLTNASMLSSTANETRFKVLNALPQAKELILNARLPEYWREIGWPKRCRPLGEDDFVCE